MAIVAALAVTAAVACSASESEGSQAPIVVFTRDLNLQSQAVWASGIAGGVERLARGRAPSLAPDGRTVAYLGGCDKSHPWECTRLALVSTSGGQPRMLLRGVGGPIVWSSDSAHVLCTRGDALVSVSVRSRRATVLARGSFFGWSFAPNGRSVVYARNGPGGDLLHGDTNLFAVRAAGGPRRALTRDGRSAYPVWGPGGKIAFVRVQRGLGQPSFELRLLSSPSGRARRLVRASHAYGLAPVAWSRDGSRLLAADRDQSTSTPVAVDPVSGRTRPIGRYSRLGTVVAGLSRDGKWVLVATARGDSTADERVERIGYTGGPPHVIARNAAEPSWNF